MAKIGNATCSPYAPSPMSFTTTERIDLELPIPGKQSAKISLPGNMDSNDWAMIDDMLSAFAERLLLKNKK